MRRAKVWSSTRQPIQPRPLGVIFHLLLVPNGNQVCLGDDYRGPRVVLLHKVGKRLALCLKETVGSNLLIKGVWPIQFDAAAGSVISPLLLQ